MTFDPSTPPSSQPPSPDVPSAPFPTPTFPSSVAAAAVPARPSAKMAGGTIALILAGVVAAGGLGFAGGRVTAPTASPATGRTGFGGNFNGEFPNASGVPGGLGNGGLGAGLGGGGVTLSGTVSAIGNGQLTLTTATGTTVTVELPATVTYHSKTTATVADVTVGSAVQVTVNGFRGNRGGGPAASGAPSAPPSDATGAAITAEDVTLTGK